MAVAHLISGLPGSGKTTYARRLEVQCDAVRFTLDVWLQTAYGEYAIAQVGYEEHVRRVLACRELIRGSAAPLLQRGVDVILDDGFFLREQRRQHVAWASGLGAEAVIHYLCVPHAELLRRTTARNANLPQHHFHIAPEQMAQFSALFEPPSAEDEARIVRVDDAPDAP